MTDLADEIRSSFEESRDQLSANDGPLALIHDDDVLAPGFTGMRNHYSIRLMAMNRRGYRWYAGSTLPTDADQLVALTATMMRDLLLKVMVSAFSDGVLIGHAEEQVVKMFLHFHKEDELFEDTGFREAADPMSSGFLEDEEVRAYFDEYLRGAVTHLSHTVGFVHRKVDPNKVWDVWLLVGTASTAAAYLAGHRMGTGWRERDVLDGIEIASGEDAHGAEGEG